MVNMTDVLAITDILLRQHEYSHAHFRFSALTKVRLERLFRGPDATPLPVTPGLQFMGIPVVVDDAISDGAWTLVDNSTREVLHSGVIGCTCELIDVSTHGQTQFVRGRSNGCVVHPPGELEQQQTQLEAQRTAERNARIAAAKEAAREALEGP